MYVTMTSANNWTITATLWSTDSFPGAIFSYTFYYAYM
jgi:hypothetical protein